MQRKKIPKVLGPCSVPGAFTCILRWLACLFVFGCAGSLLLRLDFSLWRVKAPLCCGAWASHRGVLLVQSTGPRTCGLQQLPRESLVVPRHLGSSQTRDQTRLPCIGRRILIHCNIKEVLRLLLKQHCNTAVTLIPPQPPI